MIEGGRRPDINNPNASNENAEEPSVRDTTEASKKYLHQLRNDLRSDIRAVAAYSVLSGGFFGAAVTNFVSENSNQSIGITATAGAIAGIFAFMRYREHGISATRLESQTRIVTLRENDKSNKKKLNGQ